jgi:amidase
VSGVTDLIGSLAEVSSVIPESHNQDTVGCFARTVRDATYCLDGIYGQDPRDNYTLVQQAPAGGFTQFLTNKDALKGAKFGLPWLSFWQLANANQQEQLLDFVCSL